MKFKKLTFEQVAEKRIKKLLNEVEQLTAINGRLQRENEKYQSIFESGGWNSNQAFRNRCVKNGLYPYHFAFRKDEFDTFVTKIKMSPNKYFEEIIKGELL